MEFLAKVVEAINQSVYANLNSLVNLSLVVSIMGFALIVLTLLYAMFLS